MLQFAVIESAEIPAQASVECFFLFFFLLTTCFLLAYFLFTISISCNFKVNGNTTSAEKEDKQLILKVNKTQPTDKRFQSICSPWKEM